MEPCVKVLLQKPKDFTSYQMQSKDVLNILILLYCSMNKRKLRKRDKYCSVIGCDWLWNHLGSGKSRMSFKNPLPNL